MAMQLSDLKRTPGNIIAVGISAWALIVVALSVIVWAMGSDGVLWSAPGTLKALLYAAIAWLARDRLDEVCRTWEALSGWHRILHAVEVFVVLSLVILGIETLGEKLMLR
jgi:hypothetical protein